jgi:hypothetical protein
MAAAAEAAVELVEQILQAADQVLPVVAIMILVMLAQWEHLLEVALAAMVVLQDPWTAATAVPAELGALPALWVGEAAVQAAQRVLQYKDGLWLLHRQVQQVLVVQQQVKKLKEKR